MEFSEINFCEGTGYNLKNNREKSDIIKSINDKYGIQPSTDKHKIYSDRLLNDLYRHKHLISTCTQGNKYWLYLSNINNENYSMFIDNKVIDNHKFPKIIVSNFRFNECLYKDTLFSGELIKRFDHSWTFVIDDVLVFEGKRYKTNYLQDKIKLLHNTFDKLYIKDKHIEICSLNIKQYFCYEQFKYLVNEFIPKCNYRIIGINFHPNINSLIATRFYFRHHNHEYNPIKLDYLEDNNSLEICQKIEKELLSVIENDTEETIKKSFLSLNEIDKNKLYTFEVKKTKMPNVYYLYYYKNNALKKHSIAKIETLECSKLMRELFSKCEGKNQKVACYFYPDFKKWVPKCKSHKPICTHTEINEYLSV